MCGPESFREYVERLEAIGEVQVVDRTVDWRLELGAITRRSYELRAPAPLFTAIAGAAPGFRALGAPVGLSGRPGRPFARVATSLGLPPETGGLELVETLAALGERPGVPPRLVADGPCREHVLTGEAVDLERLPAPLIQPGDGGRYVNTFGIIVVRTPDGRWTNWSISRQMILDRRRMTGLLAPHQHLGMIHAEWCERGEPMPFATVLGVGPATPFVAGMPLPAEVDEADVCGAHLGRGVPVVRCETIDLEVPADAEIVIEGHVTAALAPEGPMGEYTGYGANVPGVPRPVFEVSAITHREAPILPVVASGPPAEENHTVWGLAQAAELLRQLRARGLPVAACWMPPESACQLLVVAASPEWSAATGGDREALARLVGEEVFAARAGFAVPRVALVDGAIDPTVPGELLWALCGHCHQVRDVIHFPERPVLSLPVYLDAAEKRAGATTKVLYNCLPPDGVADGAATLLTLRDGWPAPLAERVVADWGRYGYPADAP